MEPTVPVARPLSGGPALLDCDVLCRKCGYNLRGLAATGRCPECNTPVGLSVRGDLLRFADPAWVEKVARGVTIVLWMLPISALGGVLTPLLGPFALGCFWLMLFGIGLAYFCGVWLMTTPDPSRIGETKTFTARRAVRFTLVAGVLAQVVLMITNLAWLPSPLEVFLAVLAIAGGVLALVGEYVKFIYYEQLARRVPDDSLAWRARFLRWALPVSVVLFVAIPFLYAVAGMDPFFVSNIATAVSIAWLLVFLSIVVFVVMTIFLLIRLRRALIRQAAFARATWAAAAQTPEVVTA